MKLSLVSGSRPFSGGLLSRQYGVPSSAGAAKGAVWPRMAEKGQRGGCLWWGGLRGPPQGQTPGFCTNGGI
jgi:hypothetical protein